MNTRVSITPESDSHNSYKQPITFEIDAENITIDIDDRQLSFSINDFKKLIKLAEAMAE